MNFMIKLLVMSILHTVVYAANVKQGTLSVILFHNGQALSDNQIKVDGKRSLKTDSDGCVQTKLNVGRHQIEIIGKDSKGINLGYFKKSVLIKEGKDTQVIASLSKREGNTIDVDTPVKVDTSAERKDEMSTGIGTLKGIVRSSEGDTPIAGARVFVRGTDVDTRTDENGRFMAKIPSGRAVSISVVHSAYSAQTVNRISVKKDGIVNKIIKLTPASLELEEFVVLSPKIEGSIADVMQEEKQTNAIANILGSAEFSKKGDSDAAAALKRVTGITLVDGKNIYVRGLGERYSNIEMNSLPLPSPDPTKRSVPLDIFPSSVIGSMKIQKSASADIPSAFGGGYIDIRTKDKFDDDYIKISLGVKGNSNTGKTSGTYQGSDSDFLAYDNTYRAILQEILDVFDVRVGEEVKAATINDFSKEDLARFTRDFVDRDYTIYNRDLPIGLAGSIEGSREFLLDDDNKISIFGSYGYSQEHKFVEESFFDYDMGSDGVLHTKADKYGTTAKRTSEYSHGGMFNIAYNYLDVLKLKYTKLYTRDSKKTTRVTDGIIGSNYDHQTKYYLDWEERVLNTDQISGEFEYELFNKKSEFQFGAERSNANLYQPNNYHYSYLHLGGLTYLDNSLTNSIATRLTSDDELLALYVKDKFYLDLFSKEDYIEVGMNFSTKERISRQNKFFLRKIGGSGVDDTDLTGDIESIYWEYVRNDIDYDDRVFIASPLFRAADYFDAYVDEANYYINSCLKPYDNIEIVAGVRYVDFTQKVDQYKEDSDNPDMTLRRLIQKIPEELAVNDFYPSMSVKYKYDDDNHFDAAVSRTYIVPDLREFTSGEYFHPYDVATVVGNPNLVNTDIYSIDLKYSHYISDTENIKMGLFYKYLDKPIEDVMVPSSSLPVYSYDNADYATLYGIEVDGRKNLAFLHSTLNNYFISGNFSYTESEVILREEQLSTFSTNNRQLQGLSPTVVNATLSYEKENRNVALSYNKMGERIRKVGLIDAGDLYPDHYEIPPHLLDLVWIEKLGDYVLKFKAGNLLDDETIWTQGDSITKEFKKGMTFDFSASYQY